MKDSDVLNDLRTLELIDGIIKLPKLKVQDTKDAEFKRHGDAAIALALGWYKSKNMNAGPIEYQGTGRRREYTRMDNYMRA